jgi:hypothetical protein
MSASEELDEIDWARNTGSCVGVVRHGVKALEKKTLSVDMLAPISRCGTGSRVRETPRGAEPTQLSGLFGSLWKRKPMRGVFFLLVGTRTGIFCIPYGDCWNGLGILLEKRLGREQGDKVHAEKPGDGNCLVDRKACRASFVFLVHLQGDFEWGGGLGGRKTKFVTSLAKAEA